jgi:hypothetical protein
MKQIEYVIKIANHGLTVITNVHPVGNIMMEVSTLYMIISSMLFFSTQILCAKQLEAMIKGVKDISHQVIPDS